MNKDYLNISSSETEISNEPRKPEVGDFALVELNGKTKLLYVSDASTLSQLPAEIQERLEGNRNFQIAYNTFGDNSKEETPIFSALTRTHIGEKTDFTVKRQGGASSAASLEVFNSYGDIEEAFQALGDKIETDNQRNQETINKIDSSVLYINH